MALVVTDVGYLAQVQEFACRTGQLPDLQAMLNYLATFACRREDGAIDEMATRCVLDRDRAPWSFSFTMFRRDAETGEYRPWFSGGLVFHGPEDDHGSGSAPAFATTLVPVAGWSVHT